MENFLKMIGMVVVVLLALVGLAILGAYPLKWAMNYLINPQWLQAAFGTPQIGFWQAFCLNYVAGSLIKGSHSTSSK